MTWNIKYHSQVEKFLLKSDKTTKKQILKYLNQITDHPKSFGKALGSTLKGLWRYRVGDYRIICDLQEKQLLVLVININHRSKIYKK
jgi:mRNA interferase RelE/StbE